MQPAAPWWCLSPQQICIEEYNHVMYPVLRIAAPTAIVVPVHTAYLGLGSQSRGFFR